MEKTDLKTKRVTVISLTNAPQGAEKVLLKVAIATQAKMIFVKKSKNTQLSIPPFISVRFLAAGSMVFGLINLFFVLKKADEELIIFSSHPYLNAYLGILKRLGWLKARLIARECTSVFTRFFGFKKQAYRLLYRLGYPALERIVCQTTLMREQLLEHNQFLPASRVCVCPNPVDLKKLEIDAQLMLSAADRHADFVCAAGRLITEKGFHLLIKAFGLISHHYPNLQLYILGSGPELASLKSLAKEQNLAHRIVFKGYISHPAPFFKYAKACVVSSVNEGFPNVLLEMMALNQSVVCTLCAGGIADIPGIFKSPVNSEAGLAESLNQALTEKQIGFKPQLIDYLEERNPDKFAQSIFGTLS